MEVDDYTLYLRRMGLLHFTAAKAWRKTCPNATLSVIVLFWLLYLMWVWLGRLSQVPDIWWVYLFQILVKSPVCVHAYHDFLTISKWMSGQYFLSEMVTTSCTPVYCPVHITVIWLVIWHFIMSLLSPLVLMLHWIALDVTLEIILIFRILDKRVFRDLGTLTLLVFSFWKITMRKCCTNTYSHILRLMFHVLHGVWRGIRHTLGECSLSYITLV